MSSSVSGSISGRLTNIDNSLNLFKVLSTESIKAFCSSVFVSPSESYPRSVSAFRIPANVLNCVWSSKEGRKLDQLL